MECNPPGFFRIAVAHAAEAYIHRCRSGVEKLHESGRRRPVIRGIEKPVPSHVIAFGPVLWTRQEMTAVAIQGRDPATIQGSIWTPERSPWELEELPGGDIPCF